MNLDDSVFDYFRALPTRDLMIVAMDVAEQGEIQTIGQLAATHYETIQAIAGDNTQALETRLRELSKHGFRKPLTTPITDMVKLLTLPHATLVERMARAQNYNTVQDLDENRENWTGLTGATANALRKTLDREYLSLEPRTPQAPQVAAQTSAGAKKTGGASSNMQYM